MFINVNKQTSFVNPFPYSFVPSGKNARARAIQGQISKNRLGKRVAMLYTDTSYVITIAHIYAHDIAILLFITLVVIDIFRCGKKYPLRV